MNSKGYLQRREDAKAIWWAGVEAVQPKRCLPEGLANAGIHVEDFDRFDRIIVVGGGKAGAAMAECFEGLLEHHGVPLAKVSGVVNVPNETVIPLRRVRLHSARPMGINQPTEAACAGTSEILKIAESAGPNDVMICLISGGGSALLPAPVARVSLADKQQVTKLLHECGATIQEMNAVRKHLSRIKGGGLVRHFRGARIFSLIISDVMGRHAKRPQKHASLVGEQIDPIDVIASGPTSADPTTFGSALAVLEKHSLLKSTPPAVINYLRRGEIGQEPETLKSLPVGRYGLPTVRNIVIANNQRAVFIAARKAEELGYFAAAELCVGGDTARRGRTDAYRTASQVKDQIAMSSSTWYCYLHGGETTVILGSEHGLGGRNQEYVLAFLSRLKSQGMHGITVLSGGTDGEDGPTDAAGAIGDAQVLTDAAAKNLDPADFLARHDAYHFFQPLNALFKTGLTQTNVMDLRVVLIGPETEELSTRL